MRFGVDGRGMVRTRDGAISAADAFMRVDAYQAELVFMHGARGAHVHAFGIGAMVARKRYMVAKRRGFSGTVNGEFARAAFVIDYAAVSAAHRKIIEIDARHLARAATRASRIVEEKPVQDCRAPPCVKKQLPNNTAKASR